MSKEALLEAVDKVGGQTALAEAINARVSGSDLKQANVWFWLNEAKGEVPPSEYCLAIEDASGVSRYRLRTDVYGVDPAKDRSVKKRKVA